MAAERLASTTEPEPFRPKPPRATAAVVADGCRVAGATAATCAGEPFATEPVLSLIHISEPTRPY